MLNDLRLILLVLTLSAALYFIWDYQRTKEENKRLTDEISKANDVINLLDIKDQDEKAIRDNEEVIIEEIRDAPKLDDADVAPVLDRAIDRISNGM